MMLIKTGHGDNAELSADAARQHPAPASSHDVPLATSPVPSLEQTIRAWHKAGHSQRAIAREFNIDRRKVKQIVDRAA
jgi:Helix-turn-helix domain